MAPLGAVAPPNRPCRPLLGPRESPSKRAGRQFWRSLLDGQSSDIGRTTPNSPSGWTLAVFSASHTGTAKCRSPSRCRCKVVRGQARREKRENTHNRIHTVHHIHTHISGCKRRGTQCTHLQHRIKQAVQHLCELILVCEVLLVRRENVSQHRERESARERAKDPPETAPHLPAMRLRGR